MTSSFQNDFSPRNITGFGLSDGEGEERLWANLRNFVCMTKEMCPSHRIDVLSDALRHYRNKTQEKFGRRVSQFKSMIKAMMQVDCVM